MFKEGVWARWLTSGRHCCGLQVLCIHRAKLALLALEAMEVITRKEKNTPSRDDICVRRSRFKSGDRELQFGCDVGGKLLWLERRWESGCGYRYSRILTYRQRRFYQIPTSAPHSPESLLACASLTQSWGPPTPNFACFRSQLAVANKLP